MKKSPEKNQPNWITLGLLFGVVFGAAWDNLALGLSLGLAIDHSSKNKY